jgi:hypothetical protein
MINPRIVSVTITSIKVNPDGTETLPPAPAILLSDPNPALVYCVINPFTMIVTPAPIYIRINSSRNPEKKDSMPHQVRHDDK